ncbi:RNA polymerase I enhancer binding protein [Sporothrix epigloea]|uniref:RNA polymerase I enhancer binding protein n=1 Tax=Sporothrix epigloea TaxID=1892477 RepID=A0ABP0DNZ9_9PEZI
MAPPSTKLSRVKAPPPPESDSESGSESSSESSYSSIPAYNAINTKAKPERKSQSSQFIRDAASESDGSDDSESDDGTDGDEDEDGESDGDEEDEEDDEDSYQPPQRQVFTSSIVNPSSQPAPVVGTQQSSNARSHSSIKAPGNDTTSDENEDESEAHSSTTSDDSSSSDSESEDDDGASDSNASVTAATSKADAVAKVSAPVAQASTSHSSSEDDSGDSDDSSSSSSSGDSDSDSSEDDSDAKGAHEETPAEEAVPESPAKRNEADVESSDDEMEDIPFILPPGTTADVVKGSADEDAEASGAVEGDDAPEEDSEEPRESRPVRTSDAEQRISPNLSGPSPEPEQAPVVAQSLASNIRKRPRKQVSKKSFIASQLPAPESAADHESSNAAPVTNSQPLPDPEPSSLPSAASPRKRKRATIEVPEREHDATTPAAGPRNEENSTTMRSQHSTPSAAASVRGGGGGSTRRGPQGNFTTEEVERLEAAAARYMNENQLSQPEFNALVHQNAQKHTAMWDQIIIEFPDKKRLQVILRCRRIFHNFKQLYHWSDEQDVELAELVAKHGNKWQDIASAMGRSSEDVRKRWNERVVCGQSALQSYWRFDEEQRLGQVVGELLREIQTARKLDATTVDLDTVRDMPWLTVSERMDHTRTARQCRTKWRAIQDAYHFNADGEFVGPAPPTELSNSQIKAEKLHKRLLKVGATTPVKKVPPKTPPKTPRVTTKPPETPNSSADRSASKSQLSLLGIAPREDGLRVPETARPINDLARKQVRSMTTEDKYRLVKSIHDSNVGREDKIPWSRLVDASFRRRYGRAARELVWSRLKRAVPNYQRKSLRQICEQLFQEHDANAKLGHGWDMDFDSEIEGEVAPSDDGDRATGLPSTNAIVQAIAAAQRKPSARASKGDQAVTEPESDNDEAGNDGDKSAGESTPMDKAVEVLVQPRTQREYTKAAWADGGADGDSEKHISESEAEAVVETHPRWSAQPTRRATAEANGQSGKLGREQALVAPFMDMENASTSPDSQKQALLADEIEDVDGDDDDGSGRRSRAASVDLSLGKKLSSMAGPEGDENRDGPEPASTLTLSPGLAHSQPTVRSRPLVVPEQGTGSPAPAQRPARASRFQPPKSTALSPLLPDGTHHTKRQLPSASEVEDAADAIEDADEIDKGAFHLSAISGLVRSAFTPRKRFRRNGRP